MMRYLLYDDDGVLLRKFWSAEAAEKYLQEGYRIVVLKKERVKRSVAAKNTVSALIAEFGEAPY
jgi:hypothetical protein